MMIKVSSRSPQVSVWLTGSRGRRKREKGRQKGTCLLRYLWRVFLGALAKTTVTSAYILIVTPVLRGAYEIFFFIWVQCYAYNIEDLLVTHTRNKENFPGNSQSLLQAPSLIFAHLAPHLESQSNDFIAHKTIKVRRIKQDMVHSHSTDTEPRCFFILILFDLVNFSFLSATVVGKISYGVFLPLCFFFFF